MAWLAFSLMAIAWAAKPIAGHEQAIWLSKTEETSLEIEREDFVALLKSYHTRYSIFLTTNTFEIYELNENQKVQKVSSIAHNLESVHEEHLGSYLTPQYIGYITEEVIYYFKLTNDLKAIAFTENYPAKYFDIKQFSNVYTVNLWRNILIFKSSEHTLHYIDFTSGNRPQAIKLDIKWIIGQNETNRVVQLKTFGYKSEVAIRYQNNTMDVYDITLQQHVKRFQFAEGVYLDSYDYVSNLFVLVLKSKSLRTINCKSKLPAGEMPLPDILNTNLSRTGSVPIALASPNLMQFIDPSRLLLLGSVESPEDEKFFSIIGLTNLVVTVQYLKDVIVFTFRHFESKNPEFCHPSCRGECKIPFMPCYKLNEAYLAMLLAFLIMTAFIVTVQYICIGWEKSNRGRRRTLTEEEKDELKQSMINKNPMGASILIKERRSSRQKSKLSQNSLLNLSRRSSRSSRTMDEDSLRID